MAVRVAGGEAQTACEAREKICEEIEAAAQALVVLIEDGRRKAEEERVGWEEQRRQEARRREEERRVKARETSREELLAAIDALALIRSRGHHPKGGYDGQNGIRQARATGTAAVY